MPTTCIGVCGDYDYVFVLFRNKLRVQSDKYWLEFQELESNKKVFEFIKNQKKPPVMRCPNFEKFWL